MIPEELEDNEQVESLIEQYTEGEIRFDEFQERLDFISENGYDKKDKPGKAIRDEISEKVYEYENNNIPSGREYIVVDHEQYEKIANSIKFGTYNPNTEKSTELFGYELEVDPNADNTPKIVEQNSYEYQPESETPILDKQEVF